MDENNFLVVAETKMKGKGVFAGRYFAEGELIIEFRGDLLAREELPQPYDQVEDHYMQIGKSLYMGPSGGIDDLFNHSCDPNSGLKFGDKIVLVAIREIAKGEEITWDYSTTMDEDVWELSCCCGSSDCRGNIRDFKYLPEKIQRKYLGLGIVPEYISKFYKF